MYKVFLFAFSTVLVCPIVAFSVDVTAMLSEEDMKVIVGGCDIDCESVGSCNSRNGDEGLCEEIGEPCSFCSESHVDETCTEVTWIGLDCVVDPSLDCGDLRKGTCYNPGGGLQCWYSQIEGECSVGARQCHY